MFPRKFWQQGENFIGNSFLAASYSVFVKFIKFGKRLVFFTMDIFSLLLSEKLCLAHLFRTSVPRLSRINAAFVCICFRIWDSIEQKANIDTEWVIDTECLYLQRLFVSMVKIKHSTDIWFLKYRWILSLSLVAEYMYFFWLIFLSVTKFCSFIQHSINAIPLNQFYREALNDHWTRFINRF